MKVRYNMLSLFQIADNCHGIGPIVIIIKNGIFPIIQIGIPILLIILGTLDLGKAVIASDEKQVKEATTRLGRRCAYAAAVFFMVTIVSIVMNLVSAGGQADSENISNTTDWRACWYDPMG